METCDEPHPENTSVYTVGAESNKTNAHAATWQVGAHSHILHNPVQVCELLPSALLLLPDVVKELHKHVEGAAGYIFTCFGKISPAISWVKALPHSWSWELQLAQVVPGRCVPVHRLVSQCSAMSCSSPLPLLGSCKATVRGGCWLPLCAGERVEKGDGSLQHGSNWQEHRVSLAFAALGYSPDPGRPPGGLALVSPPPHFPRCWRNHNPCVLQPPESLAFPCLQESLLCALRLVCTLNL